MALTNIAGASSLIVKRPTHLTVFEHVGEMVPDLTYLHVVVPIDLDKMQSMFITALDIMDEETKRTRKMQKFKDELYYVPQKDYHHDIFIRPHYPDGPGVKSNISIYHDLLAMKNDFVRLRDLLPASSLSLQATNMNNRVNYPTSGSDDFLYGLRRTGLYNATNIRSKRGVGAIAGAFLAHS